MSREQDAQNAARLAGWAQNPNVPIDQRLASAAQSLNYYVDQQDQIEALIEECEERAAKDEDGTYNAGYYESLYACPVYDHIAKRLRAIRDGAW